MECESIVRNEPAEAVKLNFTSPCLIATTSNSRVDELMLSNCIDASRDNSNNCPVRKPSWSLAMLFVPNHLHLHLSDVLAYEFVVGRS